MKSLCHIVALLLAFSLAHSPKAFARHVAPRAAAEKSSRVNSLKQSLLDEGYTLRDVEEQPIYYIATPTAPYNWGNLLYKYARHIPGQPGASEEVQVLLSVRYTADGYAFPEITVRELLAN